MDAGGAATIVGNLAIAFSFVVALVFGVAQVRAAARDRKERLTLETIRSLQTREFSAHFYRLRAATFPTTLAEFDALPEADQVTHIHFAYEMELLGLLVHDGTIDLDLVERTLGDFVTHAWARYEPVLVEMRRANDDRFLAEYFQWLAERMEARMRDEPRVPAYA